MGTRNRGIGIWAAALAIGALMAVGAVAENADYVSHKKCRLCHNKKDEGEQWNRWKTTMHINAFRTLSSERAQEIAAELTLAGPSAESPECLRCHVAGYDVEKKAFHPILAKEDGVQCESCHGPASEHLAPDKIMLMQKKKGEIDPGIDRLIVRPDAKTCAKCHNDESPGWNPEKYTLEDGTKVGFDFEQAYAKFDHRDPTKKKEE